jgi:hypothetical protein
MLKPKNLKRSKAGHCHDAINKSSLGSDLSWSSKTLTGRLKSNLSDNIIYNDNPPSQVYLAAWPADVQLAIFSFLDLDSIRQVMGVNRRVRALLLSHEAHILWLSKCQSLWSGDIGDLNRQMIDNLHLPTAAGTFSKYEVNLPLLLSMTPNILPFEIDESIIARNSSNGVAIISAKKDEATGEISTYHFTGEIGNNREIYSVRSDNPLPQPTLRSTKTVFMRLFRKSKAVKWSPFVSPYMKDDGKVSVSPSLVAYFEVSIFQAPNQEDRSFRSSFDALEPNVQDCIAIGLATETFTCRTGLPGWNEISYGYHSDDGGLYHGSGLMQKRASPFGPGDIVGCGIDYAKRGIFFTRNGDFLGFGWKGLDIEFLSERRLYPVVGIDSICRIAVNHGNRPFQFNLTSYSKKYSNAISKRFQFSS